MLYAIVVVLVLIADQLMKYWVTANITLNSGSVELIPGILKLVNIHNDGAAFSLFPGYRWIFVGLAAAVTIAVILALIFHWIKSGFGRWMAVLTMAGALGNAIDRAIYGYVVDMFVIEPVKFIQVFNVADIFITVGGILFCLYLIISGGRYQVKRAASPSGEDTAVGPVEEPELAEEIVDVPVKEPDVPEEVAEKPDAEAPEEEISPEPEPDEEEIEDEEETSEEYSLFADEPAEEEPEEELEEVSETPVEEDAPFQEEPEEEGDLEEESSPDEEDSLEEEPASDEEDSLEEPLPNEEDALEEESAPDEEDVLEEESAPDEEDPSPDEEAVPEEGLAPSEEAAPEEDLHQENTAPAEEEYLEEPTQMEMDLDPETEEDVPEEKPEDLPVADPVEPETEEEFSFTLEDILNEFR